MNAATRNSGTKQVMEATSSRNPSSLEEGEEGGRLPVGSGGNNRNNPNNNTEHENENKNKKAATTAVPSSSSDVVPSEITAAGTSSTATTPRYEREECPICFHVLPHRIEQIEYKFCCGQSICLGCIIGQDRAELKETGKIVEGVTPEEEQFMLIGQRWSNVCPFCRLEGAETDEEELQLLYDRIQKRHERDYTKALITLGNFHSQGLSGLPQNIEKGIELFQEAHKLDNPIAALKLAAYYSAHYLDQKEKWMEFLRRGETLGNIQCMEILAELSIDADNYKEATRLLMKAASLGVDTPSLIICYQHKMLSKADLATTLRNQQAAKDEIKTVQREFAERYKAFDERN